MKHLILLYSFLFFVPLPSYSDQKIQQETHERNSPTINSTGDVTVNITDNTKEILVAKSRFKIEKLYPKILIDYKGVSIKKIKQDFGEPDNEFEFLEGNIGPGFVSDNYKGYFYGFENGSINFYVRKGGKSATVAEVFIIKNTEILVPHLVDKGPNYPDIILGKSKFKDLFSIEKPKNGFSNWGSAPGAVYTEVEFYFGRFGFYSTYSFGLTGYHVENIENNYEILNSKKPDYVIVQ